MRFRYVGSARGTTLSCTVDSHGVSAHLLERVLRVCMDVSMTTLSSGVFHTSLVMTVWHHMTGIFIRIHHRHRHQRNKKQNSLRSQRKFTRSFRFEPSARTYEIGSNHFNRVGSGGRGFMGFLGVRWFVRVSVVTRFVACLLKPRRSCPSLLLVYPCYIIRQIYAPVTWDIGAGMLGVDKPAEIRQRRGRHHRNW